MSQLLRYTYPVNRSGLAQTLVDPDSLPSETVEFDADLDIVRSTVENLVRDAQRRDTGWDATLAEELHKAFRGMPRRIAADMTFWHRLCIAEFSDFVWLRWRPDGIPDDPGLAINNALAERFLGSRSLRGVSRNALARLYWTAETLYSDTEGYTWVREALRNQDFFQAIFERAFGLYTPAAKACLDALRDANEAQRRKATKALNHYLTTTVVATLSENDIFEILLPEL